MQSGEFLVRLIEPLLKTGLPSQKMYLKNYHQQLTSALARDAAIHITVLVMGMRPSDLA